MEIIKPDLQKAIRAIKNGKVLVCPTDTVYGLICDAKKQKAVSKLFRIKKRPRSKPIPIFVKDIKMAKKLAYVDQKQEDFLKNVWPGKITAILKKRSGRGKIGLRIPNHKFVLHLVEHTNRPLTGTSANISGRPALTKIRKVIKQFKNQKYQPDLVIDAGNLPPSKPSTVIDLTIWPPKILRY